jgi:replicative DNA helicase
VEKRDEKTPMLSDLRESGELEQTADLVLFIYREDYYNREDEPTNIARITLAKHRHGPVGELNLCFRAEYTKFENLEEHMEEPNAFDSY